VVFPSHDLFISHNGGTKISTNCVILSRVFVTVLFCEKKLDLFEINDYIKCSTCYAGVSGLGEL